MRHHSVASSMTGISFSKFQNPSVFEISIIYMRNGLSFCKSNGGHVALSPDNDLIHRYVHVCVDPQD